MKTPIRIAAAGALALALAACGEKSKPDPFLQNIPDSAALTMDTSAAAPAAAAGVIDPLPVTTAGDDLAIVHQKAQAMNEALRAVFAHLEAITSTGGQLLPGSVKQWGPANRCVEPDGTGGCVANGTATLRLRVVRYTDHVAAFKLAARATTSSQESDFQPVLAGYLVRGAMDRRGAGRIWVNLENLKLAAAGYRGQGYLAAGFAAGPVAKTVAYRMIGFTRDAGLHAPVTAAFAGWKNGLGVVRARVAGIANLDATGPADELGFWRAVWAPSLGGRAFTVVTDVPHAGGAPTGDVAADRYWFARACYPAGQATPSFKEWYLCPKTELVSGVDVPVGPRRCIALDASSGAPTRTVAIGTQATTWADTPCAAADALVPAGDRDQVLPPSLAPGDVNDDRDEDGDHTGLTPESCPTTVDASNPDPTPPGMMGGGGGGMM